LNKLLLALAALGLAACGTGAPKVQPLVNTPVIALTLEPPSATLAEAGTTTLNPTAVASTATVTPPPATPTPVVVAPAASAAPTAVPETDLLFTGDINPARCVYAAAKAANDMALPYRPLASLLQSADITIGSLDGAISDYNPPTPCIETTRNLLAPAATAQGLGFAGFDVITVATNHIKDCGLVRGCTNNSMLDTLANLRAQGIQPTGAGLNLAQATAPAIVTIHGVRFAFLGVSAVNNPTWAGDTAPGTMPFQAQVYLDAIRRAKAMADVVIILPHWGREYTGDISYDQRQGAAAMVAAGATLVIGNHPHHVQGVETFPNGAVAAYSLGNFVFDQAWSDGTLYTIEGLLLRAKFQGSKLQGIDLIPIHIDNDFQPRLADAAESAQVLQVVADSMAHAPPP
jgi:poly-gamma-glutamate capsule biosynthesis protein CapA/YwtB (metallophosphatase superfamily)